MTNTNNVPVQGGTADITVKPIPLKDHSGKLEGLRKVAAETICRQLLNSFEYRDIRRVMGILESIYSKHDQLFLRFKKELEGLTPGGSEFVDDPERCAEVVRAHRTMTVDFAAQRNKWSQLCAQYGFQNHREVTVEQLLEVINKK